MNLREVTSRFQTLCNNGYSLSKLYIEINGKPTPIEDVKLEFKSDVMSDGFIKLKLGTQNEVILTHTNNEDDLK